MYRYYLNVLRFSHYHHYKNEINDANRIGTELLLAVYIAVCAINVIGRLLMNGLASFSIQMLAMLGYAILAMVIYILFFKNRKINFTRWIFIFEAPIYLFSILMGTVFDPHTTAFTFLMIMIVFPLFILSRPIYMVVYIAFYSVLFLLMDYPVKTTSLFYADFFHIVNATLMAMGATLFTLVVRIRNLEYSEQLNVKSMTDPLTGAYNRDGGAHKISLKQSGLFIFMDVDNFKNINDTYGHSQGDEVLISLVQILKENIRSEDVIIRFGGDEFGVYLPGKWSHEAAQRKLADLQSMMGYLQVHTAQGPINVSVSIGAVLTHGEYESVDEMMKAADEQLYYVKAHGKNSYHIAE